nr:14178_t:CDS:2 [Entrophospora candida]
MFLLKSPSLQQQKQQLLFSTINFSFLTSNSSNSIKSINLLRTSLTNNNLYFSTSTILSSNNDCNELVKDVKDIKKKEPDNQIKKILPKNDTHTIDGETVKLILKSRYLTSIVTEHFSLTIRKWNKNEKFFGDFSN